MHSYESGRLSTLRSGRGGVSEGLTFQELFLAGSFLFGVSEVPVAF
jgi:hypothetical protein